MLGDCVVLLCNSVLQKKSQEVSPKRQAAQEDLVGATLEYIQGMGIVKSFNLGGKSNQKMKQAIEESRARNTKLETVLDLTEWYNCLFCDWRVWQSCFALSCSICKAA